MAPEAVGAAIANGDRARLNACVRKFSAAGEASSGDRAAIAMIATCHARAPARRLLRPATPSRRSPSARRAWRPAARSRTSRPSTVLTVATRYSKPAPSCGGRAEYRPTGGRWRGWSSRRAGCRAATPPVRSAPSRRRCRRRSWSGSRSTAPESGAPALPRRQPERERLAAAEGERRAQRGRPRAPRRPRAAPRPPPRRPSWSSTRQQEPREVPEADQDRGARRRGRRRQPPTAGSSSAKSATPAGRAPRDPRRRSAGWRPSRSGG